MGPTIDADLPPKAHIPLPQMPLWGFAWRSVLFGAFGGAAILVGYWWDQALGVCCGIVGCFLWLLPWAGWREYQEAKAAAERANDLIEGHRTATQGFLQIRLDHLQDVSARQIEQGRRALVAAEAERAATAAERDALERLVRSSGVIRDQRTGRMVSASRALADRSASAKAVQGRSVPLIEGSAESSPNEGL